MRTHLVTGGAGFTHADLAAVDPAPLLADADVVPDMAVARMVDALAGGPPFPLRGDGTQERDWTHVDDIAASVAAAGLLAARSSAA